MVALLDDGAALDALIMKQIKAGELFGHLNGFLKAKGIELKDGTYSMRIQQSCSLLTSAINSGQKGLKRARAGAAKTLEEMRQVIHEKTAPQRPAAPPKNPGPRKRPVRKIAKRQTWGA